MPPGEICQHFLFRMASGAPVEVVTILIPRTVSPGHADWGCGFPLEGLARITWVLNPAGQTPDVLGFALLQFSRFMRKHNFFLNAVATP